MMCSISVVCLCVIHPDINLNKAVQTKLICIMSNNLTLSKVRQCFIRQRTELMLEGNKGLLKPHEYQKKLLGAYRQERKYRSFF